MNEVEEIKKRYERRSSDGQASPKAVQYSQLISAERERHYAEIIKAKFGADLSGVRLLEIGAGSGANLPFFLRLGFRREHLAANELLAERVKSLRANIPGLQVYEGNALDIPEEQKFDLVFQSTVFSSILDQTFRQQLADKMLRLVSDSGIILWYDFAFNNPGNPDVKKVDLREVKELFRGCTVTSRKVTLAPPIGRRLPSMYSFLNSFSFLRTHLICVIEKKK